MHAFITGASSGIGEAIALEAAKAGYKITLVARREGELGRVMASLDGEGHGFMKGDLSKLDTIEGLVTRAHKARGPIDLLVNNAGVQIVKRTDEVDPEDAEWLFRINVLAPFRLTRQVLPQMLRRRSGTIVDISSLSALAPTSGMYHYSASKAALAAASESLRAEVKEQGVHVVTVYPGPVKTDMADKAVEQYAKDPTKGLPVGNTKELAKKVIAAVKRKKARVIYPQSYAVTRSFPATTRWVMDIFSPLPKREDE